MKKILTFGVYDLMHYGHVLLFKKAKEIDNGYNILIVAVQDQEFIQKFKPHSVPVYSMEERLLMVSSVRYVDQVIVYREVDKDIQNIDFDVLVKGPDQMHEGFVKAEEWCRNNGKQVVVVPRTEGISTSMLKDLKNI